MIQHKKRKYTEAEYIEAVYKHLGNVTIVCKNLGISRMTFYRNITPAIKEAVKEAEEEAIELVEDAFMQNCLNGDRVCQIFFLKTKGRHKGYKEEDNKKEESNLDLSKLSDKQLKQFEKLMDIVSG